MRPEPLVLGFDTAAAQCAAALVSGARVLAAMREATAAGQAERLFPLIEAVLAAGGAGWRDLAALGVGTGPGNFTGVRIGVAAARGLALALGIPAVGVTRFAVLAEGQGRPLLAAVDAGAGRLGVQLFAAAPAPPMLTDLDRLAAGDWPPGLAVIGHRAAEIAARLGATCRGDPGAPDAAAIARLAAGRLGDPGPRPAPSYLRPPDAAPPAEAPPPLLP